MPVTTTCNPNQGAVKLDVGDKQKLRYTIAESAGVQFQLQDHKGVPLLSSAAPPRTRDWPDKQDQIPSEQQVTHPLGMQFGAAGELQWRVELLAEDGSLLQVVKDCRYRNVGAADDHFDALTIFLKRDQ